MRIRLFKLIRLILVPVLAFVLPEYTTEAWPSTRGCPAEESSSVSGRVPDKKKPRKGLTFGCDDDLDGRDRKRAEAPYHEEMYVTVLHEVSLGATNDNLVNECLGLKILDAGGDLVVLQNPDSQIGTAFQSLYQDRVSVVRSKLPLTRWVQNYAGFFLRGTTPSVVGFDLNQPDRLGDTLAAEVIASELAVPFHKMDLRIHGSSVVYLEDGVAVVSRRVITDNADHSFESLHEKLRLVGIERPIWCPSLPGEPGGHMDLCVAYLLGQAFVPQFYFSHDYISKPIILKARDTLDRIALLLGSHGIKVKRLLMPAPEGINKNGIVPYYTPVNWVAVQGHSGKKGFQPTVIIPVKQGVLTMDFHRCINHNKQLLGALGIHVEHLATALPELGGGLHCLTAQMPKDLLNNKLTLDSEEFENMKHLRKRYWL